MIKKFIIVVLFFMINLSAFGINTHEVLTSIENGLFGYDYKKESDSKRVERIESYLYGTPKTGSIPARIEAIQNDSGITIIPEINKQDLQKNNINNNTELNDNIRADKRHNKNLKEDETVEYAIVDKMEKDLFKQTYKNENIYERLNRLETVVFQNTSDEDLNTRVDKLASVLRPSSRRMPSSESTAVEELQKMYNNYGVPSNDEEAIPFKLAALEHDILKHEYLGDNNSGRFSRLEQKMFNRTFPNDADTQRMQRLIAAYEAKKDSYKYENNKRMQNMATISQIGGILLMILAILL